MTSGVGRNTYIFLLLALVSGAPTAFAQQSAVDSLRGAIGRLTSRLDSLESGNCPAGPLDIGIPAASGNPVLDSLRSSVDRMASRVARLSAERCPGPAMVPSQNEDLEAVRAAAAEAAGGPDTTGPDSSRGPQFISRQRNLNVLNPEISATGNVHLVAREGRQSNNFLDREFEISFQASLDPYSATKVFLALEEGGIEVEEGYLYYSGLPGRLRLDVGKFRQQVGELNRWHRHALPETEYPLVYQRYLSDEGLGGVGLSLYTTLPVSLFGGTHEVWLQGTTAESEALFAGSGEPALLGRLQNFWQLSRSTYAQLGFTGIRGHSEDSSLTTRLVGTDVRFTWRPPEQANRREVTLRAEGYQFRSAIGPAVDRRYGAFADIQFRASQRWILGLRYDYVESPRGLQVDEWQVTPAVTWWQSEFVFLRLQFERHHDSLDGANNQLTFQTVWAMGPHKHETY
jgi:hypothetical protein